MWTASYTNHSVGARFKSFVLLVVVPKSRQIKRGCIETHALSTVNPKKRARMLTVASADCSSSLTLEKNFGEGSIEAELGASATVEEKVGESSIRGRNL